MGPPRQRRCPNERRNRALTFLAQLCVRSSGYRLRGVYGWAHANEFALLAGSYEWASLLAGLAIAGLVDVQEASVCGVEPPARLYRITQTGMNGIAGILRERAPTVPPPGSLDVADGVYASQGARWALEALRAALCGMWLSADAIDSSSRTGGCSYRLVLISDLDELVSSRLAESRTEGVGLKASTLYRATQIGRTAKLLKWFGWDPEAPIYTEYDGGPLLVTPLGAFLYGSGN